MPESQNSTVIMREFCNIFGIQVGNKHCDDFAFHMQKACKLTKQRWFESINTMQRQILQQKSKNVSNFVSDSRTGGKQLSWVTRV